MTNTFQVEQVRADQIKEDDIIWFDERGEWRRVFTYDAQRTRIVFVGTQGDLFDTFPDDPVLRQAPPISPVVTEETKALDAIDHETGGGLLNRVIEAENELDNLHAHLRAVVYQGKIDPSWTGWMPAIEALIPDSEPRLQQLDSELRDKGLGHIADRLNALCASQENKEGER